MLERLDYLVDEIISLNSKLVLLEDPPGRDKTAHRAEPANLRGMNFIRDCSKSAVELPKYIFSAQFQTTRFGLKEPQLIQKHPWPPISSPRLGKRQPPAA